MAPDEQAAATGVGLSRRAVLGGGVAAALGGAALGAGLGYAAGSQAAPAVASSLGSTTEPFYGYHQSGIATPLQASATIVSFDLQAGVDRAGLIRLMRIWTDDAARLTQGQPVLADPDSTLALVPARLTITLGFGLGALAAAGLEAQAPQWLGPLPHFKGGEKLQRDWSDGDLVLQVAAEDPMTASHAVNALVRDGADYATVRWAQRGFHRPANTAPPGTGRNLMGQVDGTVNPVAGTAQFDTVVWSTSPGWLVGGTGMVVRRIAMDLPVWGSLDQRTKEQAIGRRLADGAPLTGGVESTAADFEAVDANGFLVIPELSHMRLARPGADVERILRRPYNYDQGYAGGKPDAGLVFIAFAADIDAQFVPIQRRLAAGDLMNIWTTAIGSAVFAVPPGVGEGGYLGQTLLG